jgi:leucyl/phenylalanyl-tRNA--protein transferase
MIPFLGPLDPFPPVASARSDMGGLLAIGADLSPDRLLDAYRRGIFPWGLHEGLPIWYSPEPRMVLFPDEFKLSRSLRKTLRTGRLAIRFDHNFPAIISACATTPRPGQDGTWIAAEMIEAYCRLHELGWAHSVEVYDAGRLVGGLYGLQIGQMFYGESMFAHQTDASKAAFAYLIRRLQADGVAMIDCQMRTEHLSSLGGREIPRNDFLTRLSHLTQAESPRRNWLMDDLDNRW